MYLFLHSLIKPNNLKIQNLITDYLYLQSRKSIGSPFLNMVFGLLNLLDFHFSPIQMESGAASNIIPFTTRDDKMEMFVHLSIIKMILIISIRATTPKSGGS